MSITLTGKTIGQLTTLTGITEDTVFPVELSGTTYKISYSNIPHFKYEIGEYVQSEGGVIYHRYMTDNTQNYLVVSTHDLGSFVWSNVISASSATSYWDGQTNTNIAMSQNPTSGAIYSVKSTSISGKTDWYLPSIQELKKMSINLFEVSKGLEIANGNQFTIGGYGYWSSTESSYIGASQNSWYIDFIDGTTSWTLKNYSLVARSVRKFTL